MNNCLMYMFLAYFSFYSAVFDTKASMIEEAMKTAVQIAVRSPIGVQGSKVNLVYSRDHTVPESLHFMVGNH